MSNNIRLISVRDLFGKYFLIPDYQRGYKWEPKQVMDLLNDLYDFIVKQNEPERDSFYCMQPLVVKRRYLIDKLTLTKINQEADVDSLLDEVKNNTQWEVIDGQQRLTTIKLLLKYLSDKEKNYTISYVTRDDSADFLNKINNKKEKNAKSNSDFYHIFKVFEAIGKWFGTDKDKKEKFIDLLFNGDKVQFIWYENNEDDAIKTFAKLNIGKISLTNAELIKAIVLNQSIVKSKSESDLAIRQREIANEWDAMEKTLQNDEFWLFLHEKKYNQPTRMDFVFEILFKNNLLGEPKDKDEIGNDNYKTFRYVDAYFNGKTDLNENKNEADVSLTKYFWKQVKSVFNAFYDWYNDLEYYHYIGFLVAVGSLSVADLYSYWNGKKVRTKEYGKKGFITTLKEKIKDVMKKCLINSSDAITNLLEQQYDDDVSGHGKTKCRPILLMHNIQTIINQNNIKREDDIYNVPIFYRFPFYQYKNEKWDVEHIDSNTTNKLDNDYDRLLWLLQYHNNNSLLQGGKTGTGANKVDLANAVKDVIDEIAKNCTPGPVESSIIWLSSMNAKGIQFKWFDTSKSEPNIFLQLYDSITTHLGTKNLSQAEKNQIWNFTLLDATTNRSYGNSIFPSKRRTIMAKDSGKISNLQIVKEKGNNIFNFIQEKPNDNNFTAFIPLITRNVFMKYYTPDAKDFICWDKNDADAYKNDIKTTLSEFIK